MRAYERFLKYVQYDTASDENSPSCPSTAKQLVLANALAEELKSLGVGDARVDEHGYVYGSIPANDESRPAIGLIAHMDVVDCVPSAPVKPAVIENYDGGPVRLANGDILDYHGGLRDIQDKVLRTIGDSIVQLGNGPSEMIRYIRFHARYEGSSFAPELEAALEEHHLDYARLMAPLNAQNQLRRLWINGYAVACFDLMQDYGLVGYFYCPVAELCDTEAYQTEVRAALGALDAAYAGGESVKTYQGTVKSSKWLAPYAASSQAPSCCSAESSSRRHWAVSSRSEP